jgi:hypothetical protein
MHTSIRQIYFRFFLVFFLIITPFLVFFTLGYDINFSNNTVSNTLAIQIETIPRNASIIYENAIIGNTPEELVAPNRVPATIKIQSEGYLSETFGLYNENNTNEVVSIKNLTMLPSSPQKIASFSGGKPLFLLRDNLAFVDSAQGYSIQPYTFSGLQGTNIPVENLDTIRLTQKKPQLLQTSYWFEDTSALLVRNGRVWKLVSLSKLPVQIKYIVQSSPDVYQIVDTDERLWSLKLNQLKLDFVESGVVGIDAALLSNDFWIQLRSGAVYRYTLETDVARQNNKVLDNFDALQEKDSSGVSAAFHVENAFQGLVVQRGKYMWYVPDFNPTQSRVLADNVQYMFVVGQQVLWFDNSDILTAYNIQLDTTQRIGTVTNSDLLYDVNVYYYDAWKRLFIYNGNELITFWFDKDNANTSLKRYYPNIIQTSDCQEEVVEKHQFCLKENDIVAYKNTRLF